MDVFEAIYNRRSVRKFTPERVPIEMLKRIVRAGIEAPSGCNAQLRQYIIVTDQDILAKLAEFSPAMTGATAAIVLIADPKATPYGEFWVQDISAAVENMLLAITAEGFASCWIEGQMRPNEDSLHEILAVPENLRVWAMLPVGKPAIEARRPKKSNFEDVVYYDKFGQK